VHVFRSVSKHAIWQVNVQKTGHFLHCRCLHSCFKTPNMHINVCLVCLATSVWLKVRKFLPWSRDKICLVSPSSPFLWQLTHCQLVILLCDMMPIIYTDTMWHASYFYTFISQLHGPVKTMNCEWQEVKFAVLSF